MTEQQRESNLESAIHMLKKYKEITGSNKIDLQTAKEFMLAETDEQFSKTLSMILLLDDLTQKHIEIREIIESVKSDNDYIANTFLERN